MGGTKKVCRAELSRVTKVGACACVCVSVFVPVSVSVPIASMLAGSNKHGGLHLLLLLILQLVLQAKCNGHGAQRQVGETMALNREYKIEIGVQR